MSSSATRLSVPTITCAYSIALPMVTTRQTHQTSRLVSLGRLRTRYRCAIHSHALPDLLALSSEGESDVEEVVDATRPQKRVFVVRKASTRVHEPGSSQGNLMLNEGLVHCLAPADPIFPDGLLLSKDDGRIYLYDVATRRLMDGSSSVWMKREAASREDYERKLKSCRASFRSSLREGELEEKGREILAHRTSKAWKETIAKERLDWLTKFQRNPLQYYSNVRCREESPIYLSLIPSQLHTRRFLTVSNHRIGRYDIGSSPRFCRYEGSLSFQRHYHGTFTHSKLDSSTSHPQLYCCGSQGCNVIDVDRMTVEREFNWAPDYVTRGGSVTAFELDSDRLFVGLSCPNRDMGQPRSFETVRIYSRKDTSRDRDARPSIDLISTDCRVSGLFVKGNEVIVGRDRAGSVDVFDARYTTHPVHSMIRVIDHELVRRVDTDQDQSVTKIIGVDEENGLFLFATQQGKAAICRRGTDQFAFHCVAYLPQLAEGSAASLVDCVLSNPDEGMLRHAALPTEERNRVSYLMEEVEEENDESPKVMWTVSLQFRVDEMGTEQILRFPACLFAESPIVREMAEHYRSRNRAGRHVEDSVFLEALQEEKEEEEGEGVAAEEPLMSPTALLVRNESIFNVDSDEDDDVDVDFPVATPAPSSCSDHYRNFVIDLSDLAPFQDLPLSSVSRKHIMRILVGDNQVKSSTIRARNIVDYYLLFLKLGMPKHSLAMCFLLSQIKSMKTFASVVRRAIALFCPDGSCWTSTENPIIPGAFLHALCGILRERLDQIVANPQHCEMIGPEIIENLSRRRSLIPLYEHPDLSGSESGSLTHAEASKVSFPRLAFETLQRLRTEECLSDVTLLSLFDEGQKTHRVKCHLPILVWKSSFFFRMFRFGGVERLEVQEDGRLTIHAIPNCVLEQLLRFIYRGSIRTRDPGLLIALLQHGVMFDERELLEKVRVTLCNIIRLVGRGIRSEMFEAIGEIDPEFLPELRKAQ